MKATTERPPSFWRNPESRSILAKALFEENSYLIPKAPHQSDWATQDIIIGDGLLWLLDSNQDVLSNIMEFRLIVQF